MSDEGFKVTTSKSTILKIVGIVLAVAIIALLYWFFFIRSPKVEMDTNEFQTCEYLAEKAKYSFCKELEYGITRNGAPYRICRCCHFISDPNTTIYDCANLYCEYGDNVSYIMPIIKTLWSGGGG